MKIVACYVRVGTVGQNEAGQHREIQRWLEGNGIDATAVRWYLEPPCAEPHARWCGEGGQ